MGSWVTYGLGSENQNLPGFIAMCPGGYPIQESQNWQAGFLPGVYQGTYIDTKFTDSREYRPSGHKLERLLDLVTKAGADRYVSGPSAKDYIDPARFADAGIELAWKDYSGYPEYRQRFPPFEHAVSILDLIFNAGPDAPWYIWGWRGHAAKAPGAAASACSA